MKYLRIPAYTYSSSAKNFIGKLHYNIGESGVFHMTLSVCAHACLLKEAIETGIFQAPFCVCEGYRQPEQKPLSQNSFNTRTISPKHARSCLHKKYCQSG